MNDLELQTTISKDGTRLRYRQLGHGPGLVLVQGTMGTAYHFTELAEALAERFSVCLPDRRGRGLSDAGPAEYGLHKEVEDVAALLDVTAARFVFGLSAGALITLQAALDLPNIDKIALYEPAYFVDGLPKAQLARFDHELAQGKTAAALVSAMQAAQMGPPLFSRLPRWLLEMFVKRILQAEAKYGSGAYPTMQALSGTLPYDLCIVNEMDGALGRFGVLNTQTLLVGGDKSPRYLKQALDALEKILPNQRRITLPGLDHAAAWNYDKQRNPNGKPGQVARALCDFFA